MAKSQVELIKKEAIKMLGFVNLKTKMP